MKRNEHLKLKRAWDSFTLIRSGYFGCHNCGAHNYSFYDRCLICGAKHWRLEVPTETLSAGPPTSILQNVVYALPPVRCLLFCDVAAATFEQSASLNMTPAVALTPDANEQIEVAGGFIRCTSGNVKVVLKRA